MSYWGACHLCRTFVRLSGEWGMGNGEWGMGNGEWGIGNRGSMGSRSIW
ncbi:MAG: hypothetical protein F6K55_07380 [Moorea sp. SIO4A3]|nr:hypothetical protein [Moorena sp. SIO4A3]